MIEFGDPWPEFNAGIDYSDRCTFSDAGKTLILYYSQKYQNSAPLNGWLQRIHNNQITVNGRAVTDPNTILSEGEELVYHRFPWKEPPAPHSIGILYEDDEIIALNKPSGLQVLPGGLFQQRTVLTQLQRLNPSSSETHPIPVHRLGRGTSGVLLCAKTKIAKSHLSALFNNGTSSSLASSTRRIRKIYRALVKGVIPEDEIVVDQPIGQVKYPGVAQGLYVAVSSGKPSLSKVHILERNLVKDCTLVEVEIQTGRPHQIRIHLSFIGHPLVGDPLYDIGGIPKDHDFEVAERGLGKDGGYDRPENAVPGDCGYHLHAHYIVFPHPVTREIIRITAPLPCTLQTLEEKEEEAAS